MNESNLSMILYVFFIISLSSTFIFIKRYLVISICRYCYVSAPHTKEVIVDELMKILLDWGFDKRLSTITLDNCLVNDGVVNLLLDRFYPESLMLGGDFVSNALMCAYFKFNFQGWVACYW